MQWNERLERSAALYHCLQSIKADSQFNTPAMNTRVQNVCAGREMYICIFLFGILTRLPAARTFSVFFFQDNQDNKL